MPACERCNASKCDRPWLAWYRAQPFHSPERELKIEAHLASALVTVPPGIEIAFDPRQRTEPIDPSEDPSYLIAIGELDPAEWQGVAA